MAFVVTMTTTKGNVSDPGWNEWLSSLDDTYLSNQYPDLVGVTPQQYCYSFQTDVVEDVNYGFVSEENSYDPDTGVSVLTTIWENQAAWQKSLVKQKVRDKTYMLTGNINANTESTIVTGISTKFSTEVFPGDIVNGPFNGNVVVFGTVYSVESDTQFTLEANASFNIVNRGYSVNNNEISSLPNTIVNPMQWLGQQYINLYPQTVETTYANV